MELATYCGASSGSGPPASIAENPVRGAMQEILRHRLWLQEHAASADLAQLDAVRRSLDDARASLEQQLQRVSQARAGR